MGDERRTNNSENDYSRLIMRAGSSIIMLGFAVWTVMTNRRTIGLTTALSGAACLFVFALAIGIYSRKRALGRLTRALQESSPDAGIAEVRRALHRMGWTHGGVVPPLVASTCATYYAFYGQFDRARDELDAQRWVGASDAMQALRLYTSGFIHYLSGEDVSIGLAETRKAKELARGSRFKPGARRSREALELYIDIGRVLSEGAATALCDSLAARARSKKNIADRLLALWGAAVAMERAGRAGEAESFYAELRAVAPHCKAFHRLPSDARVSPQESESQVLGVDARLRLGACALHPNTHASVRCIRCGDYACADCARPMPVRSL